MAEETKFDEGLKRILNKKRLARILVPLFVVGIVIKFTADLINDTGTISQFVRSFRDAPPPPPPRRFDLKALEGDGSCRYVFLEPLRDFAPKDSSPIYKGWVKFDSDERRFSDATPSRSVRSASVLVLKNFDPRAYKMQIGLDEYRDFVWESDVQLTGELFYLARPVGDPIREPADRFEERKLPRVGGTISFVVYTPNDASRFLDDHQLLEPSCSDAKPGVS